MQASSRDDMPHLVACRQWTQSYRYLKIFFWQRRCIWIFRSMLKYLDLRWWSKIKTHAVHPCQGTVGIRMRPELSESVFLCDRLGMILENGFHLRLFYMKYIISHWRDPYTWLWSPNGHGHEWPTATPFVKCRSPSHSEIQLFQNLTKTIHGQVHVWSKVKVMFDLQNSKVKVMVKVKPIGHIWGLEFNRYVCFSFRGNRTTFGWDIANSIFDLENSRSRSWPRSNPMVTFGP